MRLKLRFQARMDGRYVRNLKVQYVDCKIVPSKKLWPAAVMIFSSAVTPELQPYSTLLLTFNNLLSILSDLLTNRLASIIDSFKFLS